MRTTALRLRIIVYRKLQVKRNHDRDKKVKCDVRLILGKLVLILARLSKVASGHLIRCKFFLRHKIFMLICARPR